MRFLYKMAGPSARPRADGNSPEVEDDKNEGTEKAQDEKVRKEIRGCINTCRRLLEENNDIVSAKTKQAYLADFEKLERGRHIDWMRENIFLVSRVISEAKDYGSKFEKGLADAVRMQVMTADKANWWRDKFKNQEVLEADRKAYLNEKFFPHLKTWLELGEQRQKIMNNPTFKKLTDKNIDPKALDAFNSKEKFAALSYPDKMTLVEQVEEALRMHDKSNGMKLLQLQAKGILKPLEGKCIASASRWLDRIFNEWNGTEEDTATFLAKRLPELIGRWQDVAGDFEKIKDQMDQNGVPPRLQSLSLPQFLRLDYDVRTKQVETYKEILGQWNAEQSQCANIDELISDGNFDVAAFEMMKAKASMLFPESQQLLFRMERLLSHDREYSRMNPPEQKPPRLVEDVDEEIEELINSEAPGSMTQMYKKVAKKNFATFEAFRKSKFNEWWATDRGYLDTERKILMHERAEESTADIAHRSQDKRFTLENVDIRSAERPDTGNVIRDYQNGTRAATVVHVSPDEITDYLKECETHATNREWIYWMTPVFHGIPDSDKRSTTFGFDHKLKALMREREKLQGQGRSRQAQTLSMG